MFAVLSGWGLWFCALCSLSRARVSFDESISICAVTCYGLFVCMVLVDFPVVVGFWLLGFDFGFVICGL